MPASELAVSEALPDAARPVSAGRKGVAAHARGSACPDEPEGSEPAARLGVPAEGSALSALRRREGWRVVQADADSGRVPDERPEAA